MQIINPLHYKLSSATTGLSQREALLLSLCVMVQGERSTFFITWKSSSCWEVILFPKSSIRWSGCNKQANTLDSCYWVEFSIHLAAFINLSVFRTVKPAISTSQSERYTTFSSYGSEDERSTWTVRRAYGLFLLLCRRSLLLSLPCLWSPTDRGEETAADMKNILTPVINASSCIFLKYSIFCLRIPMSSVNDRRDRLA